MYLPASGEVLQATAKQHQILFDLPFSPVACPFALLALCTSQNLDLSGLPKPYQLQLAIFTQRVDLRLQEYGIWLEIGFYRRTSSEAFLSVCSVQCAFTLRHDRFDILYGVTVLHRQQCTLPLYLNLMPSTSQIFNSILPTQCTPHDCLFPMFPDQASSLLITTNYWQQLTRGLAVEGPRVSAHPRRHPPDINPSLSHLLLLLLLFLLFHSP